MGHIGIDLAETNGLAPLFGSGIISQITGRMSLFKILFIPILVLSLFRGQQLQLVSGDRASLCDSGAHIVSKSFAKIDDFHVTS